MTTPDSFVLSLPQGHIAGLCWGPSSAPPVIALHGWLDNAATFARLAPLLPQIRLVSLDLMGHGHSSHRPPGLAYTMTDYVTDTIDVLDALGLREVTLLGHSLGGAVAALIAIAEPLRVKRIALVDSFGPLSSSAEEFPRTLADHVRERRLVAGKSSPIYPEIARAVQVRQEAGPLSREGAELLCERGLKACTGGWTWRSDPRLRITTAQRLTEEQVAAGLAAVSCPTLVIRAESGLPIPPPRLQARVAHLKALQWVTLAGGHHVHLDAPELVAPHLTRFLVKN